MNGKHIALVMVVVMALATLFIWVNVSKNDKRVGKYLAEHKCSRLGPAGMDTLYECENVTLSDSDIIKITSSQ
jgi:hypothetical protein